MRRAGWLGWICVALAAAVADATLAPVAWPMGARPDFGLIAIAVAALPAADRGRWGVAWTCGLVKDFFVPGPLGLYALLGLLLGLAFEGIGRRFDMQSPLWRLAVVVAGAGVMRVALGVLAGARSDALAAGLTCMALAAAAVFLANLRSWTGATWSSSSPAR